MWQQALDDIQREIGTKLDKMELAPLRDFVNKKLKLLQEKMKSLSDLKRDQEAAGTKMKMLRFDCYALHFRIKNLFLSTLKKCELHILR